MTTASSASLQIAQNGQNIQPLEKSVHLSIIHTTKISSHWKKQDSQQLLKRPNHPSGGKITRPTDLHTTKSSSHRRKTPAKQSSTRPKHPATGEIRTSSNLSNSQIIQPLEKYGHSDTTHTTESSTDWKKTPAQQTPIRPKHPATGEISTSKHHSNSQIIQPLEKSGAKEGNGRGFGCKTPFSRPQYQASHDKLRISPYRDIVMACNSRHANGIRRMQGHRTPQSAAVPCRHP